MGAPAASKGGGSLGAASAVGGRSAMTCPADMHPRTGDRHTTLVGGNGIALAVGDPMPAR